MKLAKRLSAVAPSATLTLAAKAKEMAAEGKDVVSLTAGEPDFLPPQHVLDAMKASIDKGETQYTAVQGIPELRKAIAKYSSRGELRYDENDVVVSTGDEPPTTIGGSSGAVFLDYGCTPGDVTVEFPSGAEVVLPGPVCPGQQVVIRDGTAQVRPPVLEGDS